MKVMSTLESSEGSKVGHGAHHTAPAASDLHWTPLMPKSAWSHFSDSDNNEGRQCDW